MYVAIANWAIGPQVPANTAAHVFKHGETETIEKSTVQGVAEMHCVITAHMCFNVTNVSTQLPR